MKTYKEFMKEAFVDFDDKTNKSVEFPKALIKKIGKMTDMNQHSAARVFVAQELKKAGNRAGAGLFKSYKTFEKMEMKAGGMSTSMMKSLFNMDKAMKAELDRTFSNAADIWRLL